MAGTPTPRGRETQVSERPDTKLHSWRSVPVNHRDTVTTRAVGESLCSGFPPHTKAVRSLPQDYPPCSLILSFPETHLPTTQVFDLQVTSVYMGMVGLEAATHKFAETEAG
ncbi:hypothetical protein Bbelb_102850 [Branchiostoma belcheri]|nr:hypothetical protein Bbelb_102850 [Branchiostoma belcheri]